VAGIFSVSCDRSECTYQACRSSAAALILFTQGALFAAIESQLLTFVKAIDPKKIEPSSAGFQALLILTYAAFFFSVSATVSSLILTDEYGELDLRAASRPQDGDVAAVEKLPTHNSIEKMFQTYGISWACRPVRLHCKCIQLLCL
jgi:hypothetical protein